MAKKANRQTGVAGLQKGMSKVEAVRRALAHFGSNAKPSEMQPWIKQQFGIEISPNHISASRGDIQRKSKQVDKAKPATTEPTVSPSPVAAKPAPAPKQTSAKKHVAKRPAPKPAATTQAPRATPGGISLPDIEAVKGLVRRVGANQLRALVDLLAK
jgi:hypothetical protein